MSLPGVTLLNRYRFDPLDQLIANSLPNEPEHQRFYCKNRLATEIQGAVHYSILQHDKQLLAQQQGQGGVLDTTLLTTDQQRSVLNTIKVNRPQQPIAHTPYGHRPIGSGLLSLLGFNGERPDPVTGHYSLGNGYRSFNPVLMRFNSTDSLSPFGKGWLNSYVYCMGNPILRTDPTGHFSEALIKALVKHKPALKIPRPSIKKNTSHPVISDSELAGFHGSSNRHITSIEKGVKNAQIDAFGPSFYATPDIEDAASYARGRAFRENEKYWDNKYDYDDIYPFADTSISPAVSNTSYIVMPSTPEIFSVHVKDYATRRPGKDFGYFPKSKTNPVNQVRQLVFPTSMHKDITARHLTSLNSPQRPGLPT